METERAIHVQFEICRAITILSDGTKVRCVVDPNEVGFTYHDHMAHSEIITCDCILFCECPW